MSFDEVYRKRYSDIIEPAIHRVAVDGPLLTAFRVDNSKTGDSILTDIVDGIAHSRLILADLSTVGKDATSGLPYRNGNVLYEVGVALACRLPEEVLLLRDDRDRFLFDVSTIPHLTIDFTDRETAVKVIGEALQDRIKAQAFARDARVKMAVAGLTETEINVLLQMADDSTETVRGWTPGGTVLSTYEHALSRLLDKGVIEVLGRFVQGHPAYRLTPLGRTVAAHAKTGLPTFTTNKQSS